MSGNRVAWRVLMFVGALLVGGGGMQHPGGQMAEMLADPGWFQSHATATVGFLVLSLGMMLFRRTTAPASRTRWWAGIATVMLACEAVEMAVHTMAYVDAPAARIAMMSATGEGPATPVLSTHLIMATIIYPITGLVLVGLMVAGMKEKALGSKWIVPLGFIGAVTHAVVMPLVYLANIGAAAILFPMITFLVLWFCLAAVWPVPRVATP